MYEFSESFLFSLFLLFVCKGGSQPEVPHSVKVQAVTNAFCSSRYGSSITDNMVCAGSSSGGVDSCQVSDYCLMCKVYKLLCTV